MSNLWQYLHQVASNESNFVRVLKRTRGSPSRWTNKLDTRGGLIGLPNRRLVCTSSFDIENSSDTEEVCVRLKDMQSGFFTPRP